MDVRPAGLCPLCDQASRVLDIYEFAARPQLPTSVAFEVCEGCNFIFAGDVSAAAYGRYYASIRNDEGHVIDLDEPDAVVRLQAGHLAALVHPGFDGRVLDFGCGQGRLLQVLGQSFPQAALYGHDVANFMATMSGIRFVPSLDGCDVRFDVIVVSHVLEHLVGFGILQTLGDLLTTGGRLYIEVPNPLEYRSCPRREFMYYFDRLHINHFSGRSMRRLLARFGLETIDRGTHRFRYRDGLYPATYHVAARLVDQGVDGVAEAVVPATEYDEEKLDAVYRAYRDDESLRARDLRHRLAVAGGTDGVLVYGAGDNFRRSRRPGGPLHELPLLAVMDRRAREMRPEPGIVFETPAMALSRFPAAPVVVTTSQRSEEIAQAIHADWPARRIFFA